MSKIHRDRHVPDNTVTKFIKIVGEQAALAGVNPANIETVTRVLERYRGGVRNK
jgi:hypothetical protein